MRVPRAGLLLLSMALLSLAVACGLQEDSSSGGGNGSDLQTVRVGYLHTPAVDTHMWLGIEKGYFEEQGLRLEPTQFDTGIALSQALSGGSIDIAIMGAVISNFPTQGVGKVFLINDVEEGTAQLWVSDDSGIQSIEDMAGQSVATTTGTTAHVFLHTALEENGVDPDSVEIINSAMPGAISSFIGGSAPAVSLWAPFDLQVQEQRPEAEMIDTAANYYPEAAIVGGWLASNDIYNNDPDLLEAITRAWLQTNTDLVEDSDSSLQTVHEAAYSEDMTLEDLEYIYSLERTFPNEEWADLYSNGTVAEWIGRVEQVFVEIGAIDEFVQPEEFFDPNIYLNTYEEAQQ
jgi:NitT/TauT family transport system substrate-binding protein